MKKSYFKILGIVLALFIINSSFLIPNCMCQWIHVNNGMGNQYVYSFAYNGNNLFAGDFVSSNGAYLSTNNGTSWTQTSLNNRNVNALAISGNNIFAGTDGYGVYLSTNNGISWTQTSFPLNLTVRVLAVNGNNIFTGTQSGGIYLTTDNGTTWIQTPLNNQDVRSITENENNIFAGTDPNGIYLSTNNGTSWAQTSLNNQIVLALAANGNNIFAGTENNGVYLSTDNGTSWTQTPLHNWVYSLATNGNNIFAGGNGTGVYISTNNGASWTQRNEGLGNLTVLGFCMLNNYIFTGTFNSVWRRPLDDLIAAAPPAPILFSPANNSSGQGLSMNLVWNRSAGTGTYRIQLATDSLFNNLILNDSTVTDSIKAVAGLLNNALYYWKVNAKNPVGTSSYSAIWHFTTTLVGVANNNNVIPTVFKLYNNYPNPFNPTTKIKFDIPSVGNAYMRSVQLKIYNVLGKEVSVLVNQQLQPGTYEADWNASNYPSGVYFYKLVSGDYVDIKKMILIK